MDKELLNALQVRFVKLHFTAAFCEDANYDQMGHPFRRSGTAIPF